MANLKDGVGDVLVQFHAASAQKRRANVATGANKSDPEQKGVRTVVQYE